MSAVQMVVGVLLVGFAVVIGGTGILALAGKLPGNGVLGVRTPETRRSPEAWELANRAAGPAFIASGMTLLLGTLALVVIGGWVGGLVVVVSLFISIALLNVAGMAGARAAAMWEATREDADGGCGCGPDGCGGHSTGDTAAGDAGQGCSPTGDTNGANDANGSDGANGTTNPADDCGVTGGCGSCALHGMCETQSATN